MRPCHGCDSPKDDRRWMSITGVSLCEECTDKKMLGEICPCCRSLNEEVNDLKLENKDLRMEVKDLEMELRRVELAGCMEEL